MRGFTVCILLLVSSLILWETYKTNTKLLMMYHTDIHWHDTELERAWEQRASSGWYHGIQEDCVTGELL